VDDDGESGAAAGAHDSARRADREVAMCECKLGIASARGCSCWPRKPARLASRPAILMSSREQFRTCRRAEGCVDTP
jgi:hypothetical protein